MVKKNLNRSTGMLDPAFIFMLKVTDFKSEVKS